VKPFSHLAERFEREGSGDLPICHDRTGLMPLKRVDKTPMPERDAVVRSHDFIEVNEGYNIQRARFEADR